MVPCSTPWWCVWGLGVGLGVPRLDLLMCLLINAWLLWVMVMPHEGVTMTLLQRRLEQGSRLASKQVNCQHTKPE